MAVCSKCQRAVHDADVNKHGACVLCADAEPPAIKDDPKDEPTLAPDKGKS